MSEKLLSWVDIRRFNAQVTEAKVQKEVETMKSGFETCREERTAEPAKETLLIEAFKQRYSRLKQRNRQKGRLLEQLRESLDSLQSSNQQAFPGLQPLSSLQVSASDRESAVTQESLTTDQLLRLLQSTKQACVMPKQLQAGRKLERLQNASTQLLKKATLTTTLRSESVNDLIHSVYTLRDRREAANCQRIQCKSQLKTESAALRRAAEDNELRLNALAKRCVLRQERKAWGWTLATRLETVGQERSSFWAFTEKQRQRIKKFEGGFEQIRR